MDTGVELIAAGSGRGPRANFVTASVRTVDIGCLSMAPGSAYDPGPTKDSAEDESLARAGAPLKVKFGADRCEDRTCAPKL